MGNKGYDSNLIFKEIKMNKELVAKELIKLAKELVGSHPIVDKIFGLKNGEHIEIYNTPPNETKRIKVRIDCKTSKTINFVKFFKFTSEGKSGKYIMWDKEQLEDAAESGKWSLHE